MTQNFYKGRRLIWKSKTEQVHLICAFLLGIEAFVIINGKYPSFIFWTIIILLGSRVLFLMVRLANPNNLFVTHGSELGRQIFSEQLTEQLEYLGIFEYDITGFWMTQNTGKTYFNWTDIETIFGFIEDVTEESGMNIFTTNNSSLHLTEKTPGWFQFKNRLLKNFPTISEDWEGDIDVPAFKDKLALLFDRKGRTQQEAEAACYSD